MCGPARNVCVCYGLWNPPTASLPNCISAPRVASWRKTQHISFHSSSRALVPVGVVNLASCVCVKSEEEGLVSNPTYSTFKDREHDSNTNVILFLNYKDSSVSFLNLWRTAYDHISVIWTFKPAFTLPLTWREQLSSVWNEPHSLFNHTVSLFLCYKHSNHRSTGINVYSSDINSDVYGSD